MSFNPFGQKFAFAEKYFVKKIFFFIWWWWGEMKVEVEMVAQWWGHWSDGDSDNDGGSGCGKDGVVIEVRVVMQ